MATSSLLPSPLIDSIYDTVEIVGNITNPLDDYVLEPAWRYMIANYSKFTIAFWFSVIVHEVSQKVQVCARASRSLIIVS